MDSISLKTLFESFLIIKIHVLVPEDIQPAVEVYKNDLVNDGKEFSDEFLLWKARWSRTEVSERPKSVADTYQCVMEIGAQISDFFLR